MLFILLLCYLIGAIPIGYCVGRLHGINIFEVGSGNMGATNVARSLGAFWGCLVFIADIGKGILAIELARATYPHQDAIGVLAVLAVVSGHNWSIFATLIEGRLLGGKGASTAGGSWLYVMPFWIAFIPAAVLVAVFVATGYVSLSVLTGTVVAATLLGGALAVGEITPIYALFFLIGLQLFYRHRGNIERLMAGNERRMRGNKKILAIAVLLIWLVACGEEVPAADLPPEPTEISLVTPATLPPTWTPAPSATPSITPSATATATETFTPAPTATLSAETVCNNFELTGAPEDDLEITYIGFGGFTWEGAPAGTNVVVRFTHLPTEEAIALAYTPEDGFNAIFEMAMLPRWGSYEWELSVYAENFGEQCTRSGQFFREPWWEIPIDNPLNPPFTGDF